MTVKKFTYADYGTPSNYPAHIAHSGQYVSVLARSGENEETGEKIYRIRAADGWEAEAYETELSRVALECAHAETCLPDYWRGHHLPHVSIPVNRKTTVGQVRAAIMDELRQGAVMGSDLEARLLSADMVRPGEEAAADALTKAAYAAVRRIRLINPRARLAFPHLPAEADDDNESTVHAYFVFKDAE